MVRAAKNVDAIVHLALRRRWPGISKEDVARITFDVNMRGTYNIFEAARISGVSTVVFASTNHVTGMYEKEGILSHPDLPIRPFSNELTFKQNSIGDLKDPMRFLSLCG